jgi:hypothetical protein
VQANPLSPAGKGASEGGKAVPSFDHARLGGISGVLFVVLFVPSYLSAPDAPVATSSPHDVVAYFAARQGGILTNNGLLLAFAAFFFVWFLGALYGLLRGAEGEGQGFSPASLAGGCCSWR